MNSLNGRLILYVLWILLTYSQVDRCFVNREGIMITSFNGVRWMYVMLRKMATELHNELIILNKLNEQGTRHRSSLRSRETVEGG